jgi:hypothetical protein
MILVAESNGVLVADTDSRFCQGQTILAPGCSWSRKLPDMDGGFDVDNPAYSDDDEDDDFDPSYWQDDDEAADDSDYSEEE